MSKKLSNPTDAPNYTILAEEGSSRSEAVTTLMSHLAFAFKAKTNNVPIYSTLVGETRTHRRRYKFWVLVYEHYTDREYGDSDDVYDLAEPVNISALMAGILADCKVQPDKSVMLEAMTPQDAVTRLGVAFYKLGLEGEAPKLKLRMI